MKIKEIAFTKLGAIYSQLDATDGRMDGWTDEKGCVFLHWFLESYFIRIPNYCASPLKSFQDIFYQTSNLLRICTF